MRSRFKKKKHFFSVNEGAFLRKISRYRSSSLTHVIITRVIVPLRFSCFVCARRAGHKCDLKSVNFSNIPLHPPSRPLLLALPFPLLIFLSLPIPQFPRLLTLQPILYVAEPCKLTEALKERTTWKRAFSLFMGFSEFPADFNATVTCLIYEKFPGPNLRSVKA